MQYFEELVFFFQGQQVCIVFFFDFDGHVVFGQFVLGQKHNSERARTDFSLNDISLIDQVIYQINHLITNIQISVFFSSFFFRTSVFICNTQMFYPFVALSVMSVVLCEPVFENKLMVLDSANFYETLDEIDGLFVYFYGEQCEFCNKATKTMEDLADSLELLYGKQGIMAKVDGNEAFGVSKEYVMEGLPKFRYFYVDAEKGKQIHEYKGPYTHQDLLNYATAILQVTHPELKTWEQYEAYTKRNEVVAVYYGKDGYNEPIKDILIALSGYRDINFGYTFSDEIVEKEGITLKNGNSYVRLFRSLEEKYVDLEEAINYPNLFKFFKENQLPDVLDFDMKGVEVIFHQANDGLFLIREANEKGLEYEAIIKKVAPLYRNQIYFCISRKESDVDDMFMKLLDYFGAYEDQLPLVFITQPVGHKHYLLDKPLTEESLHEFIASFQQGALKRFYKSESVPQYKQEYSGELRYVVGANFIDEVYGTQDDYLVLFCRNDEPNCLEFTPVYEKAVKKMKATKGVRFGKVDTQFNEVHVPDIKILTLPQVYYFKKHQKLDVIPFQSPRTEENLIKFVQLHSSRFKQEDL